MLSSWCLCVVPPSLTSKFDDHTVVEGDAAFISCAASGIPDPSFAFRKVSTHIRFFIFIVSFAAEHVDWTVHATIRMLATDFFRNFLCESVK